jgi:hypothetical protein
VTPNETDVYRSEHPVVGYEGETGGTARELIGVRKERGRSASGGCVANHARVAWPRARVQMSLIGPI